MNTGYPRPRTAPGVLFSLVKLAAAVWVGWTAGCAARGGEPAARDAGVIDTVGLLASWMEGEFSSAAQSQADPEYFDIRLAMKRVWADRPDGPWLYIEQARADLLDKPYRQRVYRLSRAADGSFRSDVYTLPEPLVRFVGCGRDADRAGAAFADVRPEQLRLLDGCGVVLRWNAAERCFAGGTEGTGCRSTRDGAAYTTSEIILTPGLLVSWDRGFDAAGEQVWGARKGGYRFVKEPTP